MLSEMPDPAQTHFVLDCRPQYHRSESGPGENALANDCSLKSQLVLSGHLRIFTVPPPAHTTNSDSLDYDLACVSEESHTSSCPSPARSESSPTPTFAYRTTRLNSTSSAPKGQKRNPNSLEPGSPVAPGQRREFWWNASRKQQSVG